MKIQLLLLALVALTFSHSQELIVIDLSVENEITVNATSATSLGTISGNDTTGFYFENFFTSDQTIGNMLVSGDITSAAQTPNNTPDLFRGNSGTDPGLNIYSYTDDPNSTFTAGAQAFSGSATWTLTPAEYSAMLDANTNGNIYFPADTSDDIAGATLLGTYSVTFPALSTSDIPDLKITYFPNPVKDVLNINSKKVLNQITIYNILGQSLITQDINTKNVLISTESLKNGAYIVQVIANDDTRKVFKVVKD